MLKRLLAITLVLVCLCAQAYAASLPLDLQKDGAWVTTDGKEVYFFAKEKQQWVLTTARNAYLDFAPLLKLADSVPDAMLYASAKWVYYTLESKTLTTQDEDKEVPALELWRLALSTAETERLVDDVDPNTFLYLDGKSLLFTTLSDAKTLKYYDFEKGQLLGVARFENSEVYQAHLSKDNRLYLYVYNRQINMLEVWQIGATAVKMPDPPIEVYSARFLTYEPDDYYIYQGKGDDSQIYLAKLTAIDQGEPAPASVRMKSTVNGYYYDYEDVSDSLSELKQTNALTGAEQVFQYAFTPDFFTITLLSDRVSVLDGQGQIHLLNPHDFNQASVVAKTDKALFKEGYWIETYIFEQYAVLMGYVDKPEGDMLYDLPTLIKVLPVEHENGGVVVIDGSPFSQVDDGATTIEVDPDNPFASPDSDTRIEGGGLKLERHGGFGL